LAEAAYHHFTRILGTAEPRPFSIDLSTVHTGPFDLSGLDVPFSKDEIWAAVKSLPLGKAPGPDGFTAEFLQSAWDV
uniref:Reverse transcriptase domain-containing protein n=1 Tax=Aegilops tauschii subsp. strangulata TaxID=200361 RepID=A0A453K0A9_AEGTS